MTTNPIILAISFTIAITIHEYFHAWMANQLGDPTAKMRGRLSINPLAHIDLVGTIIVPLFLIIARFPFVVGWAKPVRFDPFNLDDPRKDAAKISLAGPASNLILALVFSIIIRIILTFSFPHTFIYELADSLITINLVLAFFNLIPIHPLDGGKIFIGLLPEDQAREADVFLKRYGIIILFLLIFPLFGGVSPILTVLWPIISFLRILLLPGAPVI